MSFIDWVMEKKNENEHMRKYCKAVKNFLSELKQEGKSK